MEKDVVITEQVGLTGGDGSFTLKMRDVYFCPVSIMKDSEFILGELQDFGVEMSNLLEHEYFYYRKINLENVQFKHLGTVVNLFNELDDCVK